MSAGLKVVKPFDMLPDRILGVIENGWSNEKIISYLKKLEDYYGFKCVITEQTMK